MSLLLPPHHPAPQQPAPNLHLLQQPHTSPTVGNTISSHHASHKYQQQSPSSNGGYQHQSQLTYSCCFGLPYQDHNYGAPPPPSPPPVASPPSAYHHNSHHVSSSAASSRLVNGGATSGQQQHVDIENVSCTTEVLTSGAGGGGLHALSAAASAQQRVQITPPPPPPSSSSSSAVDDSITRCICQFDHDDGYMICCDKCGVWQHVDCMGVDRDNIPDKYWCELCEPRPVDAPRAHQLQNNKRQNLILIDTSATETEDETKQSPKRPGFSGGATRGRKKKLLGGGSTHHGLNKLSTGDIKQKGRRKARRGKCKDKPGGQVHSVKSIPVFKQRRNAGTGPNHRKLHMQKGTLMANTPKSPKANKVTSPKAGMSPNKALSPSALPAVTNSPPKSSPVFQPPRPWYNNGEDAYDDAAHNQYSIDIDALLIMRKNGEHGAETDNKPCCQLLDRLLNVARVNGKHKGLEAATDIGSSQAMMEYRGKVILRAQYQKQNPALYTKQSLPHVLFYSQLEGADLVIDATTYGNEGRFVRRSCCPNSEVRHLLDTGGALRFFLFSVKAIPNGSEVTIPFDFNYHECEYPVECACGKPTCPVLKLHTKPEPTTTSPPPPPALPPPKSPAKSPGPVSNLRRKKKRGSTPRVSIDEVPQPLSKRRRLSPLRMSAPPEATPTPLNHKEGRRSSHASEPETRASKTAISAPVTPTPPNNSSPDKDNEDTKAEKERRKKMTREERKLEAIMKQFAQMEKREERRRDAMARLGKSEDDGGDGGIKSPHGSHMEASAGEDITEQSPEPLIEPEPEPEEVATPVTTRTRGRRRRGGVSAMYVPGRRRSRVSSGVSSATESTHSADEGSSHAPPSSACPLSPSPPASSASSILPPHSPNVFSYPNKKKACMTEWLNEKATASKHQQQQSTSTSTTTTAETTEDDDEDTTNNNNGTQDPSTNNANPPSSSQSTASTGPQQDNEEEPTNFVRYVQSPRADPLQSHFRRRNSTPASATSGPGPYERMMSTPSTWCSTPGLPADNNAPSAAGSAKKRWLRQAMSESSPPPPPTEMPLKKRRMARASLGEAPVEKEEEVAAPKITSDKNGFNKAKDNLFEVFGSSLDSLQKDSIKEEEEDTPGERDVIYPAHPKARAFRDHSKALSPPLPPQPQRLKEEIVSVEMKEVAVKEESVNVIDQEQPSCSSSVLDRQSLKTESEVKTEYPSCSRIDGITRTYSDDCMKKEDIKMETGSPDDEGSRTLSSSAVSYSAAVADSGESLLQEPLVTERENDSCDVDHTQDTVPVQGVVEASVEEACEDFKSEVTNQAESSVAASSSTSSNIESSSRIVQDCPPSSSSQDLNVMGPPSSPPPATSTAPLSKASDEAQEDEQVSCSTETEVQGAPPAVQESEKEEGEITTDDEVQEEVVVEESAAGSGEGAEEKEEQVDSSSAIAAPPASPPPPSSPPAQATSPSSSCSASGFLEQLQARRRRRLSTGAASITGSDVTSTAGPPTSPYWGEHRSLPPASTPATPSSLAQASADFWSMSADTVADSSSSSAAATAAVGSMGSTMTDNVTSSSSGCTANVDMPEDSSPVTSSSNSLHHNHIKKKVSLLEYRKRKRPLPPRSSISSSNRSSTSSSSSSSSSSAASSTAVRHLSPLPTPPLNCTGSLQLPPALRSDSPVPSTSSPPPPPPPPQEEWKPTMAEQTQLSLTERLRREFGLDATSDEDEDDGKGRNGKDESDEEDDVPPPPPPPPPAPSHPAVQPQPVVMGLKGQSVLPHHLPQVSPRCNGRPPPLLPTPGLLPTPAGGKTHALLPTPAESAAASSSSSSSAAALSMAAAGAATVCLLQQLSSSAAAVPSAAAATAASHRAQAASAGSSTSPGFESVAAYNSAPSSSHHFPATTPSSSATSSSSSSPMVVNYNHGLRG